MTVHAYKKASRDTEIKNFVNATWRNYNYDRHTWKLKPGDCYTTKFGDICTVTLKCSRFFGTWAEYRGELGEYDCRIGKTVGKPAEVLTAEMPEPY